MITIECIVMGMLDNNVYIVSDGEATLVVDPSARPEEIVARLGSRKLDAIMCTHFHADHTGALAELKRLTGAVVYASEQDAPCIEAPERARSTSPIPLQEACAVDVELVDGDVVKVGSLEWNVFLTPGHSKGSMCWYLEADGRDISLEQPTRVEGVPPLTIGSRPILLSGDTLFAGCTGRTDFKGGSISDMQASMQKLSMLPDETIVLPGHNSYTTIENERYVTFPRWSVE